MPINREIFYLGYKIKIGKKISINGVVAVITDEFIDDNKDFFHITDFYPEKLATSATKIMEDKKKYVM